jgi:O-antigen ligase
LLWVAAVVLSLGSIALQWGTGRIHFGGDALMAAVYLASFVLATAVGAALGAPAAGREDDTLPVALAAGTLAAASASAGIALVQWTGALPLGLLAADLPPGARPFANVAQPNHLCSVAFLGLCAAALLREAGRIGRTGFWCAAALLLWTMVMSGSRTAWVQLGLLTLMVLLMRRRAPGRIGVADAVGLVALFVAGTWAWPRLNEAALLSGVRADVTSVASAGGRELLWPALLDAAVREPWVGYGWQQVVMAQQAVALDRPAIGRHFEHSHNLVLDFVLWSGIPVGLAIAGLGAFAIWRTLRETRDARTLWLLIGVLGLLAHAMFEFPHEYAYFLLPAGLALGAAHARTAGDLGLRLPRWAIAGFGAGMTALLASIAVDYLRAEVNHRMLRLETARIGVSKLETPAPDLMVLDQLQAFLEFARTEARPGMAPEEIELMRAVSERFAYPPAMFRYALAAGLNGQPEVASDTLGRLCRIHPAPRCDEGREAWAGLQQRYPQLAAIAYP